MTDGVTITYTPARDTRERVRYDPRPDAPGHWRIEETWTGCQWRIRGREPVDDVRVEVADPTSTEDGR